MNLWQSILLGIVEGVTEFLPISSTGHLILTAHVLGIPHNSFTKSFEISIQLGSILAIVFLYWQRFIKDTETWKRIIVAFIPTGIIGFILYKAIKTYLIGNDKVVVASLILGGGVLLVVDRFCERSCHIGDVRNLSFKRAFIVGVFQSLAMIPGVSRSASTIIGGMLMGLKKEKAAEFSFLLAVPTMLMATAYDISKSYHSFPLENWQLLAFGFLVAFLTATVTVKLLLYFVARYSFLPFGIYRIAVGMLYAYFML